jgi:hypothetical protein
VVRRTREMVVEVGSVSSGQKHTLSDNMHSTDATVANLVLYTSELLKEYILDVINTITNIYEVDRQRNFELH